MGIVEGASRNNPGSEGRSGEWGHQKNGHQKNGREAGLSAGAASIVLHATIEAFGPAGDAELNLTVKWPAAALAAASGGNKLMSASDDDVSGDEIGNSVNGTYDSDGNIHTPVSTPTGPVEP